MNDVDEIIPVESIYLTSFSHVYLVAPGFGVDIGTRITM
jgi:hypothetical protein